MVEVNYLNNAATSFPKPDSVISAVKDFISKAPYHHARAGFVHEQDDVISTCRKSLSVMFNCPDWHRVVFTSGSTESLNLAFRGISLKGKTVITTAVEHNSVLRPLNTLQRDGVIELRVVPCDNNGVIKPESIADAIDSNVAAIVVNHCSNVTGVVNDISAIGLIASESKIPFIVDASQSAGVYPIDVQGMNIDILAFTGHKSLYGMQGIGGAYIGEGVNLEPLIVGGTGVRSDFPFQPTELPMYFEAGTQNVPGIASLYAGVRYIEKVGMDEIRGRKEALVYQMRKHLVKHKNIILYPSQEYPTPTTVFAFNIEGVETEDIGYILQESFGITVRSGLHCAPLIHQYIGSMPDGCVRVSPSHFTSDEDVCAFCSAIDQLVIMADGNEN